MMTLRVLTVLTQIIYHHPGVGVTVDTGNGDFSIGRWAGVGTEGARSCFSSLLRAHSSVMDQLVVSPGVTY